MINGVLNVYKEKSWTSHDAVAKIRHLTGQKRIGHTGTLDPAAEGVLPVCLGKATRASEKLMSGQKIYRCTLLLGIVTDTEDMTGTILRRASQDEMSRVTPERIEQAVQKFTGPIDQIPPMYSAVRVGGRRLYTMARAGVEVERKPRRITVSDIRILFAEMPRISLEIVCSRGTYIRTICADIGRVLGCGGCMESLLRTRSGMFTLDGSLRISRIAAYIESGRLNDILIKTDELYPDDPKVFIPAEYSRLLQNGAPMPRLSADDPDNGTVRVYDEKGVFAGIYEYSDGFYRPIQFYYDHDESE